MTPGEPARIPFWQRPGFVALIVVLVSAAKLAAAAATGLARDEGYYTLWSRHLDAGYLDHPPMVAVFIALGRLVAGNGELGVRLLAVLSGAVVAAALYRIGVLLFDARTAALATLWYVLTLAFALGFITTPDTPSVLFWTLTLWAVAEFIARRRPAWWLAAGLFAGLGLLGKYTNAFLGIGLLLFLLSSRERRAWLALWQVWAGAALALLVFLPNLVWNAQHTWASLLFQGGRTVGGTFGANVLPALGEFAAGQALAAGPMLLVLTAIGIGVFVARRAPALALPVLASAPALAYFVIHTLHSRVEANWLVPLWPALALIGAWAALTVRPPGAGLIVAILAAVQAPLGALAVVLVLIQAIWQPAYSPQLDRTREMRGWPAVEQRIAELAAEAGTRRVATTGYELTGMISTYADFAGDDLIVRQVDDPVRYTYLPPLTAADLAGPLLLVRRTGNPSAPELPVELFGQTRLLAVVTRRDRWGTLENFAVFLVGAPTDETLRRAGLSSP